MIFNFLGLFFFFLEFDTLDLKVHLIFLNFNTRIVKIIIILKFIIITKQTPTCLGIEHEKIRNNKK